MLRPYVSRTGHTLLHGKRLSGKSTIATLMAVMVATGRGCAGMEPEKGAVLYADYTPSKAPDGRRKAEFGKRAKRMAFGLDAPSPIGRWTRHSPGPNYVFGPLVYQPWSEPPTTSTVGRTQNTGPINSRRTTQAHGYSYSTPGTTRNCPYPSIRRSSCSTPAPPTRYPG